MTNNNSINQRGNSNDWLFGPPWTKKTYITEPGEPTVAITDQ